MNEWFRLLTQYLHVGFAILWLGAGFYVFLVQLPALMASPGPARGPVSAQLTPRQLNYILRVSEFTIFTGVLNLIATGRIDQFLDPLAQRWTIALGLGIIIALALYGLIRARVVPLSMQMLALGPKAAGGDAAAAAQVGSLIGTLTRIGRVQLTMGALIVLAMVFARLS
jgi:hypothetical protein